MNTHIDTLREWFDNAEDGDIHEGDTFIRHLPEVGRFVVGVAEEYLAAHPDYRILHRAPRPKPAWHDAPAVTATYRDDYGTVTGVWTPSGNHGYWIGPEDDVVMHDSLEDVTPLIEAKVTDAMVERLEGHFLNTANMALPEGLARRMLTAALGLETA